MDTKTLLSFFDLRQKFERVQIEDGRKLEEPDDPDAWDAVLAPTAGTTAEAGATASGSTPDEPYYVQYQKRELEAHRRRMADERLHPGRSGGGSILHRMSGAHSVAGSHMTGIEAASSLGGASELPPNPARPLSEDLLSKYNFDNVGLEAGSKLPIWGAKEAIVNTIDNNQVTIVSGYTGCGKTTQIPQFILNHAAHNRKYVNIVVTQPRRIAAKTVAKRVCTERNWPLGKLVGYKIGLDKEFSSPDTRLLYCTTGMLKKMIISKKHLYDWTHIILDEVHEREQDMDFALLLCKKLLNTNSLGVKLILMSATLNSSKLEDYFTRELPGVSFMEKPGRYEIKANHSRHQVNEIYLDRLVKYYPAGFDEPDMQDGPRLHDANIHLCKVILEQLEKLDGSESQDKNTGHVGPHHKHAVLVFLPGEAEIMRVKRVLEGGSKAKELGWVVHVLHSKVPLDLIELAFQDPPRGYRKVILATNVAESSITIPDVKYIVDFCLTKILMTDVVTNYVSLKLEFADKNSCIQRMGRAGRVSSGRVYRLVRKSFFDECLEDSHRPEMQRAPLDKIILETKQLNFGSPKELLALALDPPDLNNITQTVMTLKVIGALLTTSEGKTVMDDGDLTPLGEMIVSLPVDVRLAKLIILGQLFNVLNETIVIAACVSQKSIFATPLEEKISAYSCKMRWAQRTFSDCFAALYAFTTWKKHVQEGFFQNPSRRGEHKRQLEWCQKRFLQLKLKVSLQRVGISSDPMPNRPILTWAEKINPLHFAIFGAFYPNYFFQRHGITDQREIHKDLNGRSPTHSVYFTGFPIQQAKYGAIYADQVKALFQPCSIPPEKIHVEFNSSRIVVQFTPSLVDQASQETSNEKQFELRGLNNDLGLTGEIIPQVFVAMKLKPFGRHFRGKERESLAISIYDDAVAQRLDRAQRKRKVRREPASEDECINAMEIGQIPPPSVAVSTLNVSVVFSASPSCFFVQLRTPAASKDMQDIDDAIEFAIQNELLPPPRIIYNLKIGNVYVTDYVEPGVDEVLYYRVRLESILTADGNDLQNGVFTQMNPGTLPGQGILHRLWKYRCQICPRSPIDYPTSGQDLSESRDKSQALECTLARLKANPVLSQGMWTKQAKDVMVQLEDIMDLEAEIYSVVGRPSGPVMSITLYGNDRQFCVNEILKQPQTDNKPALAVETSESFLSESNHENRERSHLFSDEIAQYDANQTVLLESAESLCGSQSL
ncbi:LOW QUALITY PROTEIN: probable ATP-dependent RNA helicase spindle-E [Tigriopus californicus]|uniref:LOW QUALITY PROTEIN: probable ATP-dependent RNA helicase spindle-E n=1 Tax=Tigriopus californicus TaxID=6832 RepID=UPI0027D9E76D|nr:LOW QUALITY PROTEIN: probable ATP-dependent RNA helicase spindle-E [Tigriopus californicus]